MNVADFISKWQRVELKERSASQEHFIDLCRVFEHPTPAQDDPEGNHFTFEKGASKHGGGEGWADVWKRGFFAWEYKGKHKNLDVAYDQLLKYRESLENPPLLVVCDMDRLVIHTNFTATATQIHRIALADMGAPRNIEILRALFHDPEKLRPGATSAAITAEAAQHVAEIAADLRARDMDPHEVAHFLDRIVFCLFAEDIGLLPELLFSRLLDKSAGDPARFSKLVGQLFDAMATGGDFGLDTIRHFNGNLFVAGPVLELGEDEIKRIADAAALDWSAVDPSIFGTLFERGMDPAKRSQLGAHYTSREDIETLVEPVVMTPLRREWDQTRALVENLLATGKKRPTAKTKKPTAAVLRKARKEAGVLIHAFLNRLAHVKVLDPACGSGNFLYVTLQKLKDLEKQVIVYTGDRLGTSAFPMVGPWQLFGIEINPYAHELAQMTVWIGYLQWTRANGFGIEQDPILKTTTTFQNKDAILDLSDPDLPKEPDWPAVDFIVGNPPFLGGKLLRRELGDAYVDALFAVWSDRVPREADLCSYWHEKAREQIALDQCKRAGLLATQGIRGGANRKVLQRIKETGDIFFAESDRPWILDGANVHVSMVGFDEGEETARVLDGQTVDAISVQLRTTGSGEAAKALPENSGISFMGITPAGPFDMDFDSAMRFLLMPNPNGLPNSDVLRPYFNGKDLNQRSRNQWTIDCGADAPPEIAARYERPFEYLRETVAPIRSTNRRETYRNRWWLYAETRPAMRQSFEKHERYTATCMVAKHRIFVWLPAVSLPANVVIVFARSDDYFFGVLHSRVHEVWALCLGTRLETRPRYTPTTCFETFAFPQPTEAQRDAIGSAARELDALRTRWLNPPEWTKQEVIEFPGSADGPWARYVHDPNAHGIGTVRYPRTVAKDADCEPKLKKRTLTNLYNARPTWLDLAHRKLDEAVFDAYGWDPALSDDAILEKLLALNLERAQ